MLKIRSQSSTWSSLTTPNNVEQFGDHLTKNTGPWWMDLNVITGRPCFHIWTVSSREQLKNTSGLNGDHSMWFTDPWESKIRHEEKPASIFHFWINIINVVINQMGSKVTHRITEDSTVCAAVFFYCCHFYMDANAYNNSVLYTLFIYILYTGTILNAISWQITWLGEW